MLHQCISIQTAECDHSAPSSGLHVRISWKAFQQFVVFAERYAREIQPDQEWREVYGVLVGEIREVGILDIDRAIPMLVGERIEVAFEDRHYEEIARIQNELEEWNETNRAKQFIVGWWHSHPNLGVFYSSIDAKTQLAYQTANPLAVGIVYDPTERSVNEPGLRVLRLDDLNQGVQSSREEVAFEIQNAKGEKIYAFPALNTVDPLSRTEIVTQRWVDQILHQVETIKENLRIGYEQILLPRINKLQQKFGLLTPAELGLGGDTKTGTRYRKKVEHIIEYGASQKKRPKRQAYGRLLQKKLRIPFEQAVQIKVELAPIIDQAEIYREFLDTEERNLLRKLTVPLNIYFNMLDHLSERAFSLLL